MIAWLTPCEKPKSLPEMMMSLRCIVKELGYDINYLMLRGIFAAPDIPKEAQAFYVDLMRQVTETDEFKKYTEDNALKRSFLTGADYGKWLDQAEALHKGLIQKGGLLKP